MSSNRPLFKDLGQIVNTTSIAAGASLFATNYDDNLDWVRGAVVMICCDQTAQAIIMRRDAAGQADWGQVIGSTISPTSGSFASQDLIIKTGVSAKFGLKNTAGVTLTLGKLRVQLHG